MPVHKDSRSAQHRPAAHQVRHTIEPASLTETPPRETAPAASFSARFPKTDESPRNPRVHVARTQSSAQPSHLRPLAAERNRPHGFSRSDQAEPPETGTVIPTRASACENPRDSIRTTKRSSRTGAIARSSPPENPRPPVPANRSPSMQSRAPWRNQSGARPLKEPRLRCSRLEGIQSRVAIKCNRQSRPAE